MTQPERRSSGRLPYRTDVRPLLVVGDQAYEVIDLGEHGLRVRCGDTDRWLLGSIAKGTVWFQRDQQVAVEGIVVRAGGGELALRLAAPGVAAETLLDEARYAHRPQA